MSSLHALPRATVAADPRLTALPQTARPAAVLAPFTLFCIYALTRWRTMLPGLRWPGWASLALAVLVAIAISGLLRPPARWPAAYRRASRIALLTLIAVVAAIVLLAVNGIPVAWLWQERVALTLHEIGQGIAAIPTIAVPYGGGDRATILIIELGGGALMLAAALMLHGVLAGARPAVRQRRLVISALILTVMATIPSVIVEPSHATVHALITFVLLMALSYTWRVPRGSDFGAVALLTATVLAGVLIASGLHPRHGLITVNRIVTELGPAKALRFDWNQTYGPIGPEDTSQVVLQVRAVRPAYWKAEDLDVFNGTDWTTAPAGPQLTTAGVQAPVGVGRANLMRWTQQLTFTDVDLSTDTVIAAGSAQFPLLDRIIPALFDGASPGTWVVTRPLTPGLRYTVDAYTPDPSARQLAHDGAVYPAQIKNIYLRIGHARDSGLAAVYALARRLKAGTHSPYGYLLAIDRYLHHGFVYTRNPPRSHDPIPDFLLRTHRGYCQQFAGAAALLLRMGGVPARVADGFTTGSYSRAKHLYTVRAGDAHAWIEVWFPHYGWVTFDPTSEAAQSTTAVTTGSTGGGGGAALAEHVHGANEPGYRLGGHHLIEPAPGGPGQVAAPQAGVPAVLIVLAALCLLVLICLAAWMTRWPRSGRRASTELTGELERAFSRCGRPIKYGVTLTQLQALVRETNPRAADYVRDVEGIRFSGTAGEPSPERRRALRAWLAHGRGLRGHVKALVALPPTRR